MMRPRPLWNHLRCRSGNRNIYPWYTLRTLAFKSQTDGASTSSDDDVAAKLDLLKSPAKKTSPKVLFPWHHSPDHPRRLAEREANFSEGISYDTSCQVITALTARAHLKVPLWDLLMGSQWSQELADSCSWAFAQSVASILSNTYDVPMANIVSLDEEEDIQLEFDYKPSNKSSADSVGATTNDADDDNNSSSSSNNMMETKLQNLFASAHSGKEQIEVHLKTKPTGAHLHSLHSLPALSRSIAAKHPSLIRDIEKARLTGDPQLSGNKYIDAVAAEMGEDHRGTIETTMFAEVLVYCDEVFCVRDLQTGAVVQGNEDGKARQVIHGVRMERVRTSTLGKGTQLSNWMITDIDDLLDGNRWYKPAGTAWFASG